MYVEKKDTSVTGNGELIRDPIAYWGPGSGSPTWQTVSTLGLVGLTAYGVGVAKEEFTQAETTTQPLLRTRRKRKGIMGLGLAALGVALMLPILLMSLVRGLHLILMGCDLCLISSIQSGNGPVDFKSLVRAPSPPAVNVGLGSTNAPLGLRNASSPLAGLVGAAAFGTSVAAAWKETIACAQV